MANTVTLKEVLDNPSNFDWDFALYLPPKPWKLSTNALVLDPDDVDDPTDPDDDPKIAKDMGFKYVLMMQDVDSIIENTRAQKAQPSDNEYLEAFLFYLENDAFIQFTQ